MKLMDNFSHRSFSQFGMFDEFTASHVHFSQVPEDVGLLWRSGGHMHLFDVCIARFGTLV